MRKDKLSFRSRATRLNNLFHRMNTPQDDEEIRRLLREHVPEIASGAVEIVGIAREKGQRVMIAVHSATGSICPVGSCVGPRGERIETVTKYLSGDKIDVVRWAASEQVFIRNLLAPSRVDQIAFDPTAHRATLSVPADSMTRLTEDGGVRLRLASRLSGWSLELIET
jgi:transcription termination/antitermination protein NusA